MVVFRETAWDGPWPRHYDDDDKNGVNVMFQRLLVENCNHTRCRTAPPLVVLHIHNRLQQPPPVLEDDH
jgi:hypothetical protein